MTAVYLAVAWLTGIYLASCVKAPLWALWLTLPLPVVTGVLWWRQWHVRLCAFCTFFLLVGALRHQLALPRFDEATLPYYNDSGQITLVGVVADQPDVRDRYVNLRVAARKLEVQGVQREISGLTLVQAPRYRSYAYGDELQIQGSLQTPPESEDFSYRDYLARQGVHSLICEGQITILSHGHGDPLHRALYALKARMQTTIARLFPEPSASLLTGILLGIEGGIPSDVLEDFNRTSTTHIIAISGFNITIVAGALGLLTRRFLDVYKSALLSIGGIFLYTILVGADAAVVRAAIMGGLTLLAIVAGRRTYALAGLAVAAFLMTVWNPLLLWDVGFELSFGATLGLVLLVPSLEGALQSLLGHLLPEERATQVVRFLSEPLIVTLAAQLAVWPVTIYYFHRFSVISLLTNFLILPVQPAVMMTGGLATIVGSLHPYLGQPIAWVAWLFTAYTINVVHLSARVPLSSLEVPNFGAGWMWIYYALLGIALLAASQGRTGLRRIWDRLSQGLSLKLGVGALALVVTLAWIAALQMPDGRLHVVFFDVGQGDAIFIQCPGGQQILVDGGPSPALLLSHLGRKMPFWDRDIDLVILTHPDNDHLAGLMEVLSRYRLGQVLDSGQECTTSTCAAWRDLIGEHDATYRPVCAGMTVAVGHDVRLDVLHPPARPLMNTTADLNNNSVVVRLTYGRFSVLLTGDIEQEAEQTLLASGGRLRSLVLKVPHHGGDTSLTLPFLQAVDPDLAMISVGSDNTFGHPSDATLGKLQDISTYRTDRHGTVEVVTDGERYWITAER